MTNGVTLWICNNITNKEKHMINNYIRKIKMKYADQKKIIYQAMKPRASQKQILFIVGCQRSGTSLMVRIFDKDLNSKSFSERSVLSTRDEKGFRLNPLDEVSEEFEKVRAPFIILKPLVESQNLPKLLDYFKGSKALWMYRHYKDVSASNLRHFGEQNGINDLRPIAENETGNWRNENLSTISREMIKKFYSEDMNAYDAAVLFWYARNSLFFDLELDNSPDVFICKYKDLVMQPGRMMRGIYAKVRQPYPGDGIVSEVHSQSFGKGKELKLSEEVEELAEMMLSRLNMVYDENSPAR
jgi:hypothetical protein